MYIIIYWCIITVIFFLYMYIVYNIQFRNITYILGVSFIKQRSLFKNILMFFNMFLVEKKTTSLNNFYCYHFLRFFFSE